MFLGGKVTSANTQARLFWNHPRSAWSGIMDVKDRRHRSLTRGRCGKECRYTSSSLDSEDCRVPTQKSYSSSETLKAYDHDSRMHYGNRVTDLVHRESDEFPRQGMWSGPHRRAALHSDVRCCSLLMTKVGENWEQSMEPSSVPLEFNWGGQSLLCTVSNSCGYHKRASFVLDTKFFDSLVVAFGDPSWWVLTQTT